MKLSQKMFLSLMFLSSGLTWAAAQNDSPSTQNILIEKFERVYSNLAPNDSSRTAVGLRLADLYAERARVAAVQDLESGCTVCTAGEADRAKALRIYQEAIPNIPASNLGRVLIQVGHLYEMMGKEQEAIKHYNEIAVSPTHLGAKAEAELSLAEIYFKRSRFADAAKFYKNVMLDPVAGSRGLAAYRLAWCELNLGSLEGGIAQLKKILTTPDLQSKSGVSGGQADTQFLEEVSRDYATWMARLPVGQAEIAELAKLSPANVRQGDLITLAGELERTGKKSESALVWKYVQNSAPQPDVRLEAQIRLMPLMFNENATDDSIRAYDTAMAQWKELGGCGRADCAELHKILRGFVINWNQSEKKAPSQNLQMAYQLYMKRFPADVEMAQWGAQVARDRKDWAASEAFLVIASLNYTDPKDADRLESVLLSALEVGEQSNDKALWDKAAQNYLTKSVKKTKTFEVRYQQARNVYDANNYQEANRLLRGLALEKAVPRDLRIQAAHLSLDSLNLMKNRTALIEDSAIFAKEFDKADAKEFAKIQYTASMNNVAELAKTDPNQAYAVLTAVDVGSVSPEDRELYLRNKMLLAEKSQRFDVASATVDEYLNIRTLTPEQRETALAKKAWLSELRLDFVTALRTTQHLKTTFKPEHKLLKLAIYADLSGAESENYYRQYLKLGTDPAVQMAIATQLVRTAKDPLAELKKQSAVIDKDADVLARLYTEIYVKQPSPTLLKQILSDKRIAATAWGKALARAQVLAEIEVQAKNLADHKINGSNQHMLAATIKSRADRIANFEKMAQRAVDAGDWTSQIVSLTILARESERFYQEILSLPMPEGLTPEEESQYMGLLAQQSSPYKSRADVATVKNTELWATAGWQEALQKSLNDAGEFQMLVQGEINALKSVADDAKLASLNTLKAIEVVKVKPTTQAIETARNEVRKNPMDSAAVQDLLNLEKQAGDFAMVHYLEERLSKGNSKETVQEKSL